MNRMPLGMHALLALAVVALLFFLPSPSLSHPLAKALWNLGHPPAFFVLTLLVLRILPDRLPWPWLGVLGVALGGLAIEVLQPLTGRSASAWDLLLNGIGIGLALLYRDLVLPARSARFRRKLMVLLLAIALVPVAVFSVTEVALRVQFPVLLSADGAWYRLQVAADNGLERTTLGEPDARTGARHGLRATFTGPGYSKLHLHHFVSDWRGHQALNLQLLNPETTPLEIELRVHDQHHYATGIGYDDRFNRVLSLQPGSNHVTVYLEDIRQAPRSRPMDLSRVEEVMLFTHDLRDPRSLVLIAAYLEPAPPTPAPGK